MISATSIWHSAHHLNSDRPQQRCERGTDISMHLFFCSFVAYLFSLVHYTHSHIFVAYTISISMGMGMGMGHMSQSCSKHYFMFEKHSIDSIDNIDDGVSSNKNIRNAYHFFYSRWHFTSKCMHRHRHTHTIHM